MLVLKCIQKETRENFKDYFKIQSHDSVTRNNNYSLQIPKTKLKYTKNGFFSMGVTLYNELPSKTRKIENFNAFRNSLISWGGGFSLSLVDNPSRDGVSIKILVWRHLKPNPQLL